MKSTGLRPSPCGVPIVVAIAWQSPDDRRGSSDVSARRRRFIGSSDSPKKVESTSVNLSRRSATRLDAENLLACQSSAVASGHLFRALVVLGVLACH